MDLPGQQNDPERSGGGIGDVVSIELYDEVDRKVYIFRDGPDGTAEQLADRYSLTGEATYAEVWDADDAGRPTS